jgi:hypothetical protein
VGTAYLGLRFSQNLALTNGPTIGPVLHPDVPPLGLLWWGGLALLTVIGLVKTRRTPAFRTQVLAVAAGLAMAALYFVFIVGFAPRFLLPSYAFLSIPAAVGLTALWNRRPGGKFALGAALATLMVWAGLQIATADRIEAQSAEVRAVPEQIGSVVRALAGGRPCIIVSGLRLPQIQFAAGCDRRQLRADTPPRRYERNGDRAFLVVQSPAPPPGWEHPYTVPGTVWMIYEPAPK